MSKIVLLNKPFGYLCQFSDNDGHPGLKHLCKIPKVYPAGRLDRDSEGLVLLTDDGQLQARISQPKFKLPKTYWVQVEGTATKVQLKQLETGVELKDGLTSPAKATIMVSPKLWPRDPPIRQRKNIPDCWLKIVLTEGRNRQIRRMTAAVGLPTLRLIRVQIGNWKLGALQPGEYSEMQVHLPQQKKPTRTKKRV